MPGIEAVVMFLACAAVASLLQNLTAFAFGLVLLGGVELFGIVPLADAANASMVLALVNCLAFFWGDKQPLPWHQVRHVLWAGSIGVAAGLALQVWLSANAAQWFRLLLGVTVILSAANLLLARTVRPEPSPPRTFAFFGALSGLLGGLFATSGPPIVYHMLRQPFDPLQIRRCLALIFAVNNGFRLLLVAGTGRFSQLSLLLCCVALPVALLVTVLCRRYPISIPRSRLAWMTSALLCVAGASLVLSAARDALRPLI
ncbi:TSUP family transporter [Ramlibacter tataouinensis]|uniref:TSUP family transporter n=1 Tax=Ramlibacter tataouinensis TaxID=94132 RepID=UPI0022F3EC15|nr:TSUP family transporter [Ramlibacter tataouinensis]WBY01074.1 TSUP family transporter [Ramlibacter tataouinensis]